MPWELAKRMRLSFSKRSKPKALQLRAVDRYTCATCKDTLHDRHLEFDVEDLRSAAESGCPNCSLIFYSRLAEPVSFLASVVVSVGANTVFHRSTVDRQDYESDKPSSGQITRRPRSLQAWELWEIFTHVGEPACSLPFVGTRDYLAEPLREVYNQTLSKWLKDCVSKHPDCVMNEPFLPTRVIDVSLAQSGKLRLRHCIGERGTYTALSHCWGSSGVSSQFCTTRKNLSKRLEGFSLRTLPKNFQDAVEVTRSLSVQYLWIDSICVLQDDLDDWALQASSMGSTYHNAYLVIGADCSTGCDEGFLQYRKRRPTYYFADVHNDDDSVSKVYLRKRTPHGCLIGPNVSQSQKGPLAARGWALQEQLLSRRMVHFEMEEMFWECRTAILCQCMELENQNDYTLDSTARGFMTNWKTTLEHEMIAGNYKMWQACVNQYMRRSLTFASDFLPALSGIITHLQERGLGRNLAGLWENILLHELAWKVSSVQIRTEPPRAPSWSWARMQLRDSDTAEVEFLSNRDALFQQQCIVKYSEADLVEKASHSGIMIPNKLSLQGRLMTFREVYGHGSKLRSQVYNEFTEERPTGDTFIYPDFMASGADELRRPMYGLLLGDWPNGRKFYGDKHQWIGLMLRFKGQDLQGDGAVFERVGVWVHEDPDGLSRQLEQFNGSRDAETFFGNLTEGILTVV